MFWVIVIVAGLAAAIAFSAGIDYERRRRR
jgi:hypothetical protein